MAQVVLTLENTGNCPNSLLTTSNGFAEHILIPKSLDRLVAVRIGSGKKTTRLDLGQHRASGNRNYVNLLYIMYMR